MPGFVVHALLGDRVLARGTGLAFPADDPAIRHAFLSGCSGPDMGYYPGGDTLVADLAHYVRTGELARALVREARTAAERAFAWGWVSHVLADVLIHPLVNLAAGDHRGGGPLTYADDPWLHLAVETGADGEHFARWEKLGHARLPLPSTETADHVGRAYRAAYGPAVGAGAIRATLRAWGRWHGFSVALAGAASAALYGRSGGRHGRHGLARRLARAVTGPIGPPSRLHALTHPIAPSARAAAAIARAIDDFPERFAALLDGGLEVLPDYNLDTGTVEPLPTYRPTAETLARLAARVGGPAAG